MSFLFFGQFCWITFAAIVSAVLIGIGAKRSNPVLLGFGFGLCTFVSVFAIMVALNWAGPWPITKAAWLVVLYGCHVVVLLTTARLTSRRQPRPAIGSTTP